MNLAEVIPNALLCVLALSCAACSPPEGRRAAIACAWVITADWLLYILSWTPYSLHAGFEWLGIDASSREIWPVVDAIAGAVIIGRGFDKGWAWTLWGCLFAQVILHGWRDAGIVGMESYYTWLDRLFWGQIAVFLFIGGPGVINHVGDFIARFGSPTHRLGGGGTVTTRAIAARQDRSGERR